jgi:gas vesicle protein
MQYEASVFKLTRRTHLLGLLVGAIAGGLVVWKYRDVIGQYTKGNAGSAREKVDGILGTVQRKSETLLDRAKVQVSSRLENAREKVRAGGRRQENLPSDPYPPRSEGA